MMLPRPSGLSFTALDGSLPLIPPSERDLNGLSTARSALCVRCTRAAHRRPHDGNPSHQAPRRPTSPRSTTQSKGTALESKSVERTDRGSWPPCPRTSARPCATMAAATPITRCSGRSWAPTAAERPAGDLAAAIESTFGGFDAFKETILDGRRHPFRQRLGLVELLQRQTRSSKAPPIRTVP